MPNGLEREAVPGLPPEPLAYFKALMERQLGVMAAMGHGTTPVYITEMNGYTRPAPVFLRNAYTWLDGLNRTGPCQSAGRVLVRIRRWFGVGPRGPCQAAEHASGVQGSGPDPPAGAVTTAPPTAYPR